MAPGHLLFLTGTRFCSANLRSAEKVQGVGFGRRPLALGAALAAEPASLSGDELRRAVSGKTVYLTISGFELPIRYSPSGSMEGSMGVVAATVRPMESG